MYKIAVCIPTFRRQEMLQKLLDSILITRIDRQLISKVDVVVVDNDADQSAKETFDRFHNESPPTFVLHYYNYREKGLTNVRNELIRRALDLSPDFLACIDDDEYVTEGWLHELIYTLVKNKGDLAVGPVIPVFEKRVPVWISHWFRYHKFKNHQIIHFIETGNLVIRARLLHDYQDMRFDQRFNTTGAEDSYFGVTALKKGIKIWWANEAIAYETIPPKRATIKWLLQRSFRGANTYTYMIIIERQYLSIFKKSIVNFLYLFMGLTTLIFVPLPIPYRYYGPLKIAESLGGFAALLNFKYHEYLKER